MLKPILWLWLVVGIAPVCLLAGYVLFALSVAAWTKRDFAEDGLVVLTFTHWEGLGAAHHVWPALAVLLGAGLVTTGFAKMFSPMPESKTTTLENVSSLVAALEPLEPTNPTAHLSLASGEFGPMLIIEREATTDNFIVQINQQKMTAEQFDAALGAIDTYHGQIAQDMSYRQFRTVRIQFPSREAAADYATAFFRDVAGLSTHAELHYFD